MQQVLAAEIVASREVELDETARIAPARRRARLDAETRFPCTLQEDPTPGMRDVGRHQISGGRQARNSLSINVERLGREIPGDSDRRALVAVRRAVLEIIVEGLVN